MTNKIDRLIGSIPAIYSPKNNRIVNAILSAWAQEHDEVETQLEETKKQIFLYTAEEEYLDDRASDVDVLRPQYLTLSDVTFRDLIVKLSYTPKQIRKTIYDVLDIFWGPTYSRSNITAQNEGPFNWMLPSGITGVATVTNGLNTISGVGTFFTTDLTIGDYVKLSTHDNSNFVRVINIIDDNNIVIDENYTGQSGSGILDKYTSKSLKYIVDDSNEKELFIDPQYIPDTSNITTDDIANAINQSTNDISASSVKTIFRVDKFLNLRTNTPGITGNIQITGGDANSYFDFLTQKNTIYDLEKSTLVYEINSRELILKIPNLVARLERTLLGACHLHNNVNGFIKEIDNINKTITATINQTVFEDELVGNTFAQGLEEAIITGNSSCNVPSTSQLFSFLDPSTSWVVEHNLENKYVNFTIYDLYGNVITPNSVSMTNENEFEINFPSAEVGYVRVVSDNNVIVNDQEYYIWTIAHNLGNQYVNVQVFDEFDNVIIPSNIEAIDSNTIEITFPSNIKGKVSVYAAEVHTQAISSSVWTVTHTLGIQHLNLTVYDSSNNVIVPSSISAIDEFTTQINFPSAESGYVSYGKKSDLYCIFEFGPLEDLTVFGISAISFPFLLPDSTWNIKHEYNNQYCSVCFYDINDTQIYPTTLTLTDSDNADAVFSSTQDGYAYVNPNVTKFDQLVSATTWNINHNLDEKYLNIQVFNTSNVEIVPTSIIAIDENNIQINFPSAESGYVLLNIGTVISQDVAQSLWNINHNIGNKYVNVTLYNSSDTVFIPTSLDLIDNTKARAILSSSESGHAVIGDMQGIKYMMINNKYPNSFVFDPKSSFTPTKIRTRIGQAISAGEIVTTLLVDDASNIPNQEGYIVFNFGRYNQEEPVKYLARPNNGVLILDPSHVFNHDHREGDIINLISHRYGYTPRDNGQDYGVYATGREAALNVVKDIIERLKAVGVVLKYDIYYPTYRFVC